MTKSDWLAIASMVMSIMTMLIAPLWGAWIISRINHPKPKPDAANPKNLARKISGWLIRFVTRPWVVPPLGIALNIYLLHHELQLATPITRDSILTISMGVASIAYNLALISILTNSNQIWKVANQIGEIIDQIGKIAGILHKESDFDSELINLTRSLRKRVERLEKEPKNKKKLG